jgi:hypothetical protein
VNMLRQKGICIAGMLGVWSLMVASPALGQTISTVAGTGTAGYTASEDGGAATSAKLSSPTGVFITSSGEIYIADYNNHRIRKVDTNGDISTVAGSASSGFSGDGSPATSATLNAPRGVYVTSSGEIYIADTYNHRIRKVDTNGDISTVVGNPVSDGFGGWVGAYSGDGGPATSAKLDSPHGLHVTSSGEIYIADTQNSRIRKVDTNGDINTVAGSASSDFSGDGNPATSATLNGPRGVYVTSSGEIYIADTYNQRIRKVDSNGDISTVVGNPVSDGFGGWAGDLSGDGGLATSAKLDGPRGLHVTSSGEIFIADTHNQRIRKVDTNGKIYTVAGSGATGGGSGAFAGDDGAATSARLNGPQHVFAVNSGLFYIADLDNQRIRKVVGDGGVTSGGGVNEPIGLPTTANSAGVAVDIFDFTLADLGTGDSVTLTVSQIVLHTSGTGPFEKVIFRLNGTGVSNVAGTYNSGASTITFPVSISLADGGSETYTVNAYYSTNTGLTEGQTFVLSVDGDTDLTVGSSGTQMGTTSAVTNGTGSTVDVTATKLVFTTQPSPTAVTSGIQKDFTTDPVVQAQDAVGNKDAGYSGNVTLGLSGSNGNLSLSATGDTDGVTVTLSMSGGELTFTNLLATHTATVDGQTFQLEATSSGLTLATSGNLTSDVVATKLVFSTQPSPLSSNSGEALGLTTVPVMEVKDEQGKLDANYVGYVTLGLFGSGSLNLSATGDTDSDGRTVTLPVAAGQVAFTGLTMTYTSSSSAGENFQLRASSGNLTTADSSPIVSITINSDGTLTEGDGVIEPVKLPTTASMPGSAVNIFDFVLTDGGTNDNKPLIVSEVRLHTSGTAPFASATFRLNGPDVNSVTGVYSANTLTFSGLNISVAHDKNEIYTVNAYYKSDSMVGAEEGQTFVLRMNGDNDLTVGSAGTQMSGSNGEVNNGAGSAVDVEAERLEFSIQPGGSVSGAVLIQQPEVRALGPLGVIDKTFTGNVTLAGSSVGDLAGNIQKAIVGVATFTGLKYTAKVDKEQFALTASAQGNVEQPLVSANPSNTVTSNVVATKLVFTTQPKGAVHKAVLGQQPVVVAQDANSVKDADFGESVTLGVSVGTPSDNVVKAASGVVTFTQLVIDGAGDGRTLTVTAAPSGIGGTSASFNIAKAKAQVAISRRDVNYDATPQGIEATTTPADLNLIYSFMQFMEPPSAQVPAGPGIFEVTATVDDANYEGSAEALLVIYPPPPPKPVLKASTLHGLLPLEVTFTDASEGHISTRYIEIYEGESYKNFYSKKPLKEKYTFEKMGRHKVLLVVHGVDGSRRDRIVYISVHPKLPPDPSEKPPGVPGSQPPEPVLKASTQHGPLPLEVTFTDASRGYISGRRIEITEDGETKTFERTDKPSEMKYTFEKMGRHKVSLVVQGRGEARSHVYISAYRQPPDQPGEKPPGAPEETPPPPFPTGPPPDQPGETPPDTPEDVALPPFPTGQPPDQPGETPPDTPEDVALPPFPTGQPPDQPEETPPDTPEEPAAQGNPPAQPVQPPPGEGIPALPPLPGGNGAPSYPQLSPLPPLPGGSGRSGVQDGYRDAQGELVRGLFGEDLEVGFDDFFLFADHFGLETGMPGFEERYDLDGSGLVDFDDFFIFADYFGRRAVEDGGERE